MNALATVTALGRGAFPTAPPRVPAHADWALLQCALLAHALHHLPSREVPEHRLLPCDGLAWVPDSVGREWAMNLYTCEFADEKRYSQACGDCDLVVTLTLPAHYERDRGECIAFELRYRDVEISAGQSARRWLAEPLD